MGSGLCSGAGCTVTTGNAIGGDTLSTLAGKLACAIANNASLFNLNGGSCAGGVVSPSAPGVPWGGYGSANPIGFVVINGAGLAFDFNSNISLKVTSSVSGAATEIVTIGNTTCGTRCSYSLDNNPAIQLVRNSGGAPQPGSTIAAIYAIGGTSACPTGTCVNYGNISNWVGNSTAGAIQSAWLLQTPNTSGTLTGGVWVGQGAYSNSGGAPFAATAIKDMGTGTFNVGPLGCYYLGFTNSVNGDAICQNGSGQLTLSTTTDNIIISSSGAGGVGINITPTGATFTSGLGGFFSGPQVPTTGSGISVQGTATPAIVAENYGSSTFLPLVMQALTWDFKPSNSATSGWTMQANKLAPDADNVTQIGDATHNVSTVFTKAVSGMTTPLSVAQGGTGDTGTAWTTFTPAPACGTATITTASARSKTIGKTTFIQGDFTITVIGTCAVTNVTFNLPNTAQSAANLTGRELLTNTGINCQINASGTQGFCLKSNGGAWAAEQFTFSGVYENQ